MFCLVVSEWSRLVHGFVASWPSWLKLCTRGVNTYTYIYMLFRYVSDSDNLGSLVYPGTRVLDVHGARQYKGPGSSLGPGLPGAEITTDVTDPQDHHAECRARRSRRNRRNPRTDGAWPFFRKTWVAPGTAQVFLRTGQAPDRFPSFAGFASSAVQPRPRSDFAHSTHGTDDAAMRCDAAVSETGNVVAASLT